MTETKIYWSSTLQLEIVEQAADEYAERPGYRPDFLDEPVPLPALSAKQLEDAAPLLDGSGHVLDYTHFSLVMSRSRRIAIFTAVNIDGTELRELKRGRDRWYFDTRINKRHQIGPSLYSRNALDRGHLVRRLDPVWGRKAAVANEDTFHFTNCSPQHQDLNRREWRELEDYIINHVRNTGRKASVFTGPVLRPDDRLYRKRFLLPADFWKVAVAVNADGQLSATAYLRTQRDLLSTLERFTEEFHTFQVPIAQIEELTGLSFGNLSAHDPMSILERTGTWVINGPDDVLLL